MIETRACLYGGGGGGGATNRSESWVTLHDKVPGKKIAIAPKN